MITDNMSPMMQRIQQFDLKHGSNGINTGEVILYADGAYRDVNPLGALYEPPREPRERAQLIVRYAEEKLRRAAATFDEFRKEVIRRAKANLQERHRTPPPPCDTNAAVQKLEAMKSEVMACQLALEEARCRVREMLEATKPQFDRDREAANRVNAQANQTFLDAVEGIKI